MDNRSRRPRSSPTIYRKERAINTSVVVTSQLIKTCQKLNFREIPVVEISLDCFDCQKRHRTVAIVKESMASRLLNFAIAGYSDADAMSNATAICTPTAHAFPAILDYYSVNLVAEYIRLELAFQYEFSSFFAKSGTLIGQSSRVPTWVRLHFTYTCPRCGIEQDDSIQTNAFRPRTSNCRCGQQLFTETEEPKIQIKA